MGKRLAESGYAVLTVNPFYRTLSRATPASRDARVRHARTLSPATHVTDAKAFVAWLDAQKAGRYPPQDRHQGYCMGGPIVMRTAGTVPERIGAGCTFHGGGLNTATRTARTC